MPKVTIEQAIEDIRQGKMVILVDDEDRENEGDLCMAADAVTPEAVNFMAKYGRGLICLSLTAERCDHLELPMMVRNNTSPFGTGFTISIEAREGVSTGISAADRARTIQAAIADDAKPADLVRPGHIFPLRARDGGVIVRTGQTEGSVDLSRLAGRRPFGVICEIMNDDGTMSRMPQLEEFSTLHGINICTVADLVEYRMRKESFVHRRAEAVIPTDFAGDFNAVVYENDVDDYQHIAMVKGTLDISQPVLVRVHSECMTGDIFGSMRCDCGDQLREAMRMMDREGSGVLLYIRQEGRGIGLANKIKAYALQDKGFDTVDANLELGFKADERDFRAGAQILTDLGLSSVRLMTNNPEKLKSLESFGVKVIDRVPLVQPDRCAQQYLETKRDRMGHLLP